MRHKTFQKAILRSVAFVYTNVDGALLTAGKCKEQPPEEPKEETTGQVQEITVQLQLVSVEPDTVQSQKGFSGLIFGAALEDGARVRIGDTFAERVSVEDATALSFSMSGLSAGTYDVTVVNPDGAQSSLRQALTVENGIREECRFVRVYFEFDKATLDAQSRANLDEKMSCFQDTSAKIRIEGHTDERGTVDTIFPRSAQSRGWALLRCQRCC